MARPPKVAGGRPHTVSVRLSRDEKAMLDTMRGSLEPSAYLRLLLNRAGKGW